MSTFLEKLGSTLSAATNTAVEKTKQAAAIAKLRSEISRQNKIIKTRYSEIGREYYDLMEEGLETTPREYVDKILADYVTDIKDAKAEIDRYEQEILTIQEYGVAP